MQSLGDIQLPCHPPLGAARAGLTDCSITTTLEEGEVKRYSFTVGPSTPAMTLQIMATIQNGVAAM